MRALAVLTVRNEAAFLLEWLAHHKAVGFTDFLIFSNDCEDGTAQMLDRLAAMGEVVHVPNPGPHAKGPQWEALTKAPDHPLMAEADWVMVLDIDEFVNIHTGDGTLDALIEAVPNATAITMTWRLFGNAGVVRYNDAPITAQFRRAAPARMIWPWRAAMFKTLFRNDGTYSKLGVHRPRSPDPDRVDATHWVDGCGRTLDDTFKTTRIFNAFGRDNYELVQLNHYALGSMESYLLKTARGRANREDGPMGMDYWVERNWNQDEDNTIAGYDEATGTMVAQYLADAELAELMQAAVAWRKSQFETLMLDERYRALFGRLIMTPPSQPVPENAARFMFGFAQKARQNQG